MAKLISKTIALRVLIPSAVLAIWIGSPIRLKAQTQVTPQIQLEDLKVIDAFFDNAHHLTFSGCEQSAWRAMHQAVRADIQRQELPPSSVENDIAQDDEIILCSQKIHRKEIQAYTDLNTALRKDKGQSEVMANPTDAKAAVMLALTVDGDRDKMPILLEAYNTLGIMKSFAEEASRTYLNHADGTRYRNLVTHYNALVDVLATVRLAPGYRLPVEPHALHCESNTNSVTGITQMDCR